MNYKIVRYLALLVAVLAVAMFFAERMNRGGAPAEGALLLPEFRSQVESVVEVRISGAGTETPIQMIKAEDSWIMASRFDHPADLEKIRAALLAMVNARTVETKTADPERFALLGLTDPSENDSDGVKIEAVGDGFSNKVILGDVARTEYRYARLDGENQSWLIDQNPEIPQNVNDWLVKDIVDIPNADIQSITISHPDGERIRAFRAENDVANLTIAGIPPGRELGYPTIANGMAGVLSNLQFEDVRRNQDTANPERSDGDQSILATISVDGGLTVAARTVTEEDAQWVSFTADTADDADDDTVQKAASVTATTNGWQYRLPSHQQDLLTRHWDDLLKDEAAE